VHDPEQRRHHLGIVRQRRQDDAAVGDPVGEELAVERRDFRPIEKVVGALFAQMRGLLTLQLRQHGRGARGIGDALERSALMGQEDAPAASDLLAEPALERFEIALRIDLLQQSRYDPLIMSNTGSTPKSHRLLERALLAFFTVGTVLGVATIIFVYRIMSGFRDELLQRPGAADDPALLEAIAHESNVMLLILALIVLAAAFNIAAGFLIFRRSQPMRAG
jgi:hypothetical protein